jgi:plasmid replication initiation protein
MAKKKKQSLPSSIITQSNHLVEARYNLSLGEQRLILTMISRIQPDDEDFKPYTISIGELAEFLGVAKGSAYHECKKITKSLLSRVLEIREDGRLLQTHWVSSADYVDGTGIVNLSIDPLLKPHLLQLKGGFTSCKLDMSLSFKSQYTIRIYTLLKQYERLGDREIELHDLREMLGIGKDQYKLYANFKTDLLKPVKRELEDKADLYFEFDEIKYGRRVGAIRFNIITKKPTNTLSDNQDKPDQELIPLPPPSNEISNSLDQLLALVPEQHRQKKTILSALESFEKKYGFDYVKRNILYSNIKADKSYAGYLNNALRNDWGHDWNIDQKTPVPTKKKALEVWERAGFGSEKEYNEHMYQKQMKDYGFDVGVNGVASAK